MTLFKIENLDPTKRLHPDGRVSCRWILSAINAYEPLIPDERLKRRFTKIKEIVGEAVADDEIKTMQLLNDKLATKMVISWYNVAYPRPGYVFQQDLATCISSTVRYLKSITHSMKLDDDAYKYKF